MEPMQYFRLLRRRWLIIYFFVAVGAALGYASTVVGQEETGPEIIYWTAGEVSVINPDTGRGVDLQRLSVFATGGAIPAQVADTRGMDVEDLIAAIRTVSNGAEGTLTISAVATSAEEARDISVEITTALLNDLGADTRVAHEQALLVAQDAVQVQLVVVTDLDAQIAVFTARDRREGALSLSDNDQLRSLTVQRDAALTRFATSEDTLAGLQRVGAAAEILIPLDSVPPFRISEREFFGRLAQGRQGQNNFLAGQVSLADTSSPTVSERLEAPVARGILGGIAGLALGLLLVSLHIRLDPRLRSRIQTESAFGLPVVAEIPLLRRKERHPDLLHARDQPRSAVTEAHRYLRSVLLFAKSGAASDHTTHLATTHVDPTASVARDKRDVRVLMVTSPGEGEGKTTTAVNLAVLMAEAGYDTVLINCDFRKPTAHKAFGLEHEPGVVVDTGIPNLRFISDVEREDGDTPGEISERQRELIRRGRVLADLLILDTAPVLATNDAIDILPETDLVVLVSRDGKTTKTAARDARELLIDRMGVPVVGVVVTAVDSAVRSGYYEKYRNGSYFDNETPGLLESAKGLFSRGGTTEPAAAEPAAAETPAAVPAADLPAHAAQPPATAAAAPAPAPVAPVETPAVPTPEVTSRAAELDHLFDGTLTMNAEVLAAVLPAPPAAPLNGVSHGTPNAGTDSAQSSNDSATFAAPPEPKDKIDLIREEWLASRERKAELDIRE